MITVINSYLLFCNYGMPSHQYLQGWQEHRLLHLDQGTRAVLGACNAPLQEYCLCLGSSILLSNCNAQKWALQPKLKYSTTIPTRGLMDFHRLHSKYWWLTQDDKFIDEIRKRKRRKTNDSAMQPNALF